MVCVCCTKVSVRIFIILFIVFVDQSEKRKIASDQETSIGDVNKKMKLSNGDNFKKTDILDAMLKGASYGYGDHGTMILW